MNPEEQNSSPAAAPPASSSPAPEPQPAPAANPPAPSPAPQPTPASANHHVGEELTVTQPGEVTICEIKRHPIGIITVYAVIVLALALIGYLVFGLMPGASSGSDAAMTRLGTGIFLIVALLGLLYAMIATVVYWGNRWIVTSDSVTQINRTSLFGKESSQLALSNIEDVTATQHGLLSHIFNFGVLNAETAGHHGKFVFKYAPNPNYYAQKVLAAREALPASARHHG